MIVSLDTETFPLEPGCKAPPLVAVSWATDAGDSGVYGRAEGLAHARKWLDSGVVFVGCNIAFDWGVLCAADNGLLDLVWQAYEQGRVRDVGIREQLIDIAAGTLGHNRPDGTSGYSLAALTKHHGGPDRFGAKSGGWRLRYAELRDLPVSDWPAEAREYAINDARDTLFVFGRQGGAVVDEVNQVAADWALHLCSMWGMRTDPVAVREVAERTELEYRTVQEKLFSEGYFRTELMPKARREAGEEPHSLRADGKPLVLVKDVKKLKARVEELLAAQGIPVPRTATGAVSTSADTLARTGDPLLAELSDAGPTGTILHTFVPVLRRGTERPINTRYQVLVQSGRISSSEPNLNNQPRSGGVRECFVPRSGFAFVAADYNCAELRSWAQVCQWLFGFSKLGDFFRADPHGDPHLELAASMLGITPDEAKARKADPVIKAARQASKAVNFGLPGGMGAARLAESARLSYGTTMTLEEAYRHKNTWFDRWPEGRLYLEYIGRRTGMGPTALDQMAPPAKRPHRTRGGLGYSDGANTLFQGLTADGAKRALVLVSQACYTQPDSPLYGSRPVGFLYDEILCEVPRDNLTDAAAELERLMVAGMSEWVPDVPIVVEAAAMARWTKDAKKRVVDGELQIYGG